MLIGIIYFLVIVLANTIGAISGMGGGVIIKPVLDLLAKDSVAAISFYSTVAVFTMSLVSTWRQVKNGISLNWRLVAFISAGSVLGGIGGNVVFERLLLFLADESLVQLIQISLTIVTLVFAFLYSRFDWKNYHFNSLISYFLAGLVLGFLASLLGIGGGPINVSLLMLLFSFPIKEATIYSIATIFFSQLAKIVTIAFGMGFGRYDLTMLFFVIPAAILGGLLGSRFNHLLSPKKVTLVFQAVIALVLLINVYNGWQILAK